MSKFIKILVGSCIVSMVTIIGIIVISCLGYNVGSKLSDKQLEEVRETTAVINNSLYADRYRSLLNKYLRSRGYVSLERLVFYLQRVNNVLDTSTLSYEAWDDAYIVNSDINMKQMIPIKTMCNNIKEMNINSYTIESGTNEKGIAIDKIDLCMVDGVDITSSNDFSENYLSLPYVFPFDNFVLYKITSIVFEQRNVDLGLSNNEQSIVNLHNGWDLSSPIGTTFKSVCDGRITNIVMGQKNDLPFSKQPIPKNKIGNYIHVLCDNGLTAMYHHIKYNSLVGNKGIGSSVIKGENLAQTSTTGLSTGPHLHLGLKDANGKLLDAFSYIDFTSLS